MHRPRSSALVLGSVFALCLGCGDTAAPTTTANQSPSPPPGTESPSPPSSPPSMPGPMPTSMNGFIWGQVIDDAGVCIRGATIEIVNGPGTGRSSGQPDECDAWAYDGYEFANLPVGATVTLRAMAPGYQSQERQVTAR